VCQCAEAHRPTLRDVDCCGAWDGRRLLQLVCNLVVNAVKYGAADEAVRRDQPAYAPERAVFGE
jgi:signal transduction histidine kinase